MQLNTKTLFCTMWKVSELRIYSSINPRMTKKSTYTSSLWSEQCYHPLIEAEKEKKKRCGQNHCSQLNIHPSPPASGQQQTKFFKYQILSPSFLTVISDSELGFDVLDKIPPYYSQVRLVTKPCRENEETKSKMEKRKIKKKKKTSYPVQSHTSTGEIIEES